MPISADWTADIGGSLVFGAGTASIQIERNIEGIYDLGQPRVYTVGRGPNLSGDALFTQGAYDARQLVLPIQIATTSPTLAEQARQALVAAWSPSSSTYLDIRIPGTPQQVMRYYGHPETIDVDPANHLFGWMRAQLVFQADDPYAYGSILTQGTMTSGATIVNNGDAYTDRATLSVHGSGGTPVLINTTTGGTIAFGTALASGGTFVIDMREHTVTQSSVNRDQYVSAASNWFNFAAGTNVVTFTGAGSLTVAHRPAWH